MTIHFHIGCSHTPTSWVYIPATPPAKLLSVIGIARCIARIISKFFSLPVIMMLASSFDSFGWCVSFSFRCRPRFLRAVCQKSKNSRRAKPPKAMPDKRGDTYGGRFCPNTAPPKPASKAPVALHTEIKAFTPNERLRLEIPTDRPTIKLSVEEAKANRKASRKRDIADLCYLASVSPMILAESLSRSVELWFLLCTFYMFGFSLSDLKNQNLYGKTRR